MPICSVAPSSTRPGDGPADGALDRTHRGRRMLRQRHVHWHQGGEPAHVHATIAEGARHARVHLRNQRPRRLRRGKGGIDRGAERHETMLVGRRDVQERRVERQEPFRNNRGISDRNTGR